jgi:hypothetical protein
MTLREVTRKIINLVERGSGCPVVVSEPRRSRIFQLPESSAPSTWLQSQFRFRKKRWLFA